MYSYLTPNILRSYTHPFIVMYYCGSILRLLKKLFLATLRSLFLITLYFIFLAHAQVSCILNQLHDEIAHTF